MASTSTLHNSHTRFLLRITDKKDSVCKDFSLYSRVGAESGLQVSEEGFVNEAYKYSLQLLSTERIECERALIRVNGGDYIEYGVVFTGNRLPVREEVFYAYQLVKDNAISYDDIFDMSYGFASIGVTVIGRGFTIDLTSRDILCVCPVGNHAQIIGQIFDELINGEGSIAMNWMLAPLVESLGNPAFVEGATVSDSSKSLRSYLELVERVFAGFEASLPYLRSRPHSRTIKVPEVIDARRARKIGRGELFWLAQNATVMRRVPQETGIRVNKDYYLVKEVRTERVRRTYNNLENSAVCSFLHEVVQTLGSIYDAARSAIRNLEAIEGRLGNMQIGEGILPSLVVVRACLEHERPLVQAASSLRRRGVQLSRTLSETLPGAEVQSFKLPRRTKVFQEIAAYSRLYDLMLQWADFGVFQLTRDGLALRTYRMDKLYEYYALYRLLRWFAKAGFVAEGESAIQQFHYTLRDRYFTNEKNVANYYRLVRGDECVQLYYQPVIYGDAREEGGIVLHRTTSCRGFEIGADSYWTPDYLLVYSDGQASRQVILDAKFSSIKWVAGLGSNKPSLFDESLRKYKLSIAASNGGGIEAVWLLCGRSEARETRVYQGSSWFSQSGLLPDGVVSLSPNADDLDKVFALLGINAQRALNTGRMGAEKSVEDEQLESGFITQDAPVVFSASVEPDDAVVEESVVADRQPERDDFVDLGEAVVATVPNAPSAGVVERERVNESFEEDGRSVLAENGAAVADAAKAESDTVVKDDAADESDEATGGEAVSEDVAAAEGVERVVIEDGSAVDVVTEDDVSRYENLKATLSDEVDMTSQSVDENSGELADNQVVPSENKGKRRMRRRISNAVLTDELLGDIRKACDITSDKSALFSARSAQLNFGFNHPLLRRVLPTGREAKLYTRQSVPVHDGQYFVYQDWKPDNIIRLQKVIKSWEAESASEQEKNPGPAEDTQESEAISEAVAVVKLVKQYLSLTGNPDELMTVKGSHDLFKVNRAVVLCKPPKDDERKYYACVRGEGMGEVFVLSAWKPYNLHLLKMAIAKEECRKRRG